MKREKPSANTVTHCLLGLSGLLKAKRLSVRDRKGFPDAGGPKRSGALDSPTPQQKISNEGSGNIAVERPINIYDKGNYRNQSHSG
jgi:hypothetical protein